VMKPPKKDTIPKWYGSLDKCACGNLFRQINSAKRYVKCLDCRGKQSTGDNYTDLCSYFESSRLRVGQALMQYEELMECA